MLKIKLVLFKLKNFFVILKSRLLKKKLNSRQKSFFVEYIEKKNFSQKWFLNNFEIFHHYLPKNLDTNFSYLEIGSYEGLSALNILFNYKNSKVTTIDLWAESNINSESLSVDFNEIEKRFMRIWKDINLTKLKMTQ